jgi:hypothetical protein
VRARRGRELDEEAADAAGGADDQDRSPSLGTIASKASSAAIPASGVAPDSAKLSLLGFAATWKSSGTAISSAQVPSRTVGLA